MNPLIAVFAALLLGLISPSLGSAVESTPDILKTDLMVVVAHPDDEGIAAAVMTRYALGEGKTVACVHATRGEGGGNEVGTQIGPAMGQLREAELREALRRMGVRHLYFLDKTDWAYTESAAATLEKWGHEDSLGRLVRLIRNLRPEVIVTFMPAPIGGQHGHHQVAGILATEAFTRAADSQIFPDQLKREGLRTWQPKRLFYVGQHAGGKTVSVETNGKAPDGRSYAEIAMDAMTQHQSQGFGNWGGFRGPAQPSAFTLVKSALPPDTLKPDDLLSGLGSSDLLALLEPVDYQLAPAQAGTVRLTLHNSGKQTLLLKGIRLNQQADWILEGGPESLTLPKALRSGERFTTPFRIRIRESVKPGQFLPLRLSIPAETEDRKRSMSPSAEIMLKSASLLEVGVVPLPGIARYRNWTRAENIEQFATALPSWVPLAAGQPGTVRVEVLQRTGDSRPLNVRLVLPEGWKSEPQSMTVSLNRQKAETYSFQVTPPANATVSDVTFQAEVTETQAEGGAPIAAADAVAQVTPYAEVTRADQAPQIDGDLSDWKSELELNIPSSNRVQGEFKDDADGSAAARLTYDGRFLYVGVQVRDEVIVSNIAPDDIKGHWRTDSVEITVDPTPRSESSLTTFKVGIFPWDTAGNPRAARDADANQGTIEETAPEMRLASKRTEDGYIIETAIPWSSIGATPKSGMRLGFNLLLYDGDQKDARIGDGIGEGRLAWSPRPGVWGRPEGWGEIRLR